MGHNCVRRVECRGYARIVAGAVCVALGWMTGCATKTTSSHPVVTITAVGGSPQSAQVGSAFAAPLVVTVTGNGKAASGVPVIFTAPALGASGTFAGSNTDTETTDANGQTASKTFTANSTVGAYAVTATISGVTASASFTLTNTAASVAIAANSGSGQNAHTGAAFAAPLVALVTVNGSSASGVSVTFAAPGSGASGTFAGGSTTDTATTDASGKATSSTFTANSAVGTYSVTASVAGAASPASFSLTNTGAVTQSNYVFYVSGSESINTGPNTYGIAGAVTIDTNGNVLAGEQDYNDAFGITSPQPSGDSITGGTLAVDGTTGQGTLTLITNNGNVGGIGTEQFAIQFVNAKHALIAQFDGTATSSGSLDLQVLPSAVSGGYAFTISGVDVSNAPMAFGGVFTVSNGNITGGEFDVNTFGNPIPNTSISGTVSALDSFGRGTINSPPMGIALNYYVVGPEVLRLIDVDTGDVAVGSAFGQGAGSFTSASLGASVFGIGSESATPSGNVYVAAGMLSTSPGSLTFQGVGDEEDSTPAMVSASAISGTYMVGSDGYGNLTITNSGLGSVVAMGLYMTDPTLNLSDPNNTSGGGGALVMDMGPDLGGGVGVMVPQTNTSASGFNGNYAFGALNFSALAAAGPELDFVGLGSVANGSGAFNGTGMVSDPYGAFTGSAGAYSGVPFSGTVTADTGNAGRYMNPVTITAGGTAIPFNGVVIYQASGARLFWADMDPSSLWLGPMEQQGSLAGLPAAKKGAGKLRVPGTHF